MAPIAGKHSSFQMLEESPPNGGTPAEELVKHDITPNDQFFVRSHGSIPHVDPAAFRLVVEGAVAHPLSLSLDDLRAFPRRTLIAALQCAGNRRVEMQQVAPIPGELIWDREAISSGEWGGIALEAVLSAAGVDVRRADSLHAAFEGRDQCDKDGEWFPYGSSIPLAKALDGTVLLADTLNGAPLPPEHGYPLRVFAPGYIGARSVKWIGRITIQDQPSQNYYQAVAYKLYPPNVQPDHPASEVGMMLGELPVNAAIASPQDGASVLPGKVVVRGYALSGGRGVARVDVSADDGSTWEQAVLHGDDLPFAWRLWSVELDLSAGDYRIVARAWDQAANTQPDHIIWNYKGYMNNACPRIRLQVKG